MIDPVLTLLAERQRLTVSLVPGQPSPSAAVRAALADGPPLAGVEREYFDLHGSARHALAPLFGAADGPLILAGPAALGAWAAALSTVRAGERAFVLDGGPLAGQLHDAVSAAGAEVHTWHLTPGVYPDLDGLRSRLHAAAPDWVGLVYCEPEHATLCPLPEVLRVVREGSAALVCVDARAALVGAPLAVDDWGIDLCLASADHALSVPVDAALVTVSPAAWRRAEAVGYRGWEALSRWRDPSSQPGHPYAPGANALYALAMSARELLGEGLDLAQARHREVAWYARDRVRRADLGPFPTDGLVAAPTITGVLVPANMPWAVLADGLVERGVALGRGSDGAGRPVALCGHMGAQADLALVKRALDALIDLVPLPAYGRD